jgi:hypothetical protein
MVINNMPPCGFGNRLLYYYNLRQEAHEREWGYFCNPWHGHQFFEGNMLGKISEGDRYEILNFCLGERFYSYDKLSTRDIFKLKEIPDVRSETCAVHFRGTDFHTWNPKSILNYEYYYDSINEVKDSVSNFVLFTDDVDLESFKKVKYYLDTINFEYSFGENTNNRQHYIDDFSYMTECDWIISSPSTFCISAGIIGKQKNIIHSKNWVMDRIIKEDKFWVDLYNGGNEDYKLWRLI